MLSGADTSQRLTSITDLTYGVLLATDTYRPYSVQTAVHTTLYSQKTREPLLLRCQSLRMLRLKC